jgi:glucan phosphoethanolaminetransferase (alkaline phosphatase superfamily)
VKAYIPYEVSNINESFKEPISIVYIIGESVNYTHMSLFGYDRDTTPLLKKLSNSQNVYYTTGISGGISTVASCKFMMNVLREADNAVQASKDTTNLFKLAKSKGFKTFYLSNQTEHLLSSISGVNYIDVVKTKDSNPIRSSELMDDYLIEMAASQKFTDRNFIVFHQRCIHTPYSKAFRKNFKSKVRFNESKNLMIDEYDNAMLYNDHVISDIFNYFNERLKGKFYIIWTSDHNELMGENNLFGHGHGYLLPQTANVPVIIQSNDVKFMNKVKSIFMPTHYEIAESIANILGYEIKNPNNEGNVFYISGVDFNGKCGYIEYKKDLLNKKIEYRKR